MILISAHLDRVLPHFRLAFRRGRHIGLLDNILGVLVTYLTLYDDPMLLRLEREGVLRIWHNLGEEWGRLHDAPALKTRDRVIVVDVASGPQYRGKHFGIENVSGLTRREQQALKADLTWHGFTFRWARYTGDPRDADEAWSWRARGIPVFSFIIPVRGAWHRPTATVSADTVLVCRQALKRIIAHYAA